MNDRPNFGRGEDDEIEAHRPLAPTQIFEIVRRNGEHELERPAAALMFSAIAAGLAMGFSVLGEAALALRLPDAPWAGLVADMGYTLGFLIVIFGRLQLFTESTITPVLPICYSPTRASFAALGRLWGIVLAGNFVGATAFAAFFVFGYAATDEIVAGMLSIGQYYLAQDPIKIFSTGIGAGFLIAALVWMLAHMKSGAVLTVFIITYLIAIAGFAHVIAGSVEMAMLVFAGEASVGEVAFGFILPALAGNTIGGGVLFALIAYAQIRSELK